MSYQILKNFIVNRLQKRDIYVPAMILFLLKNDGWGTKEQISRLIYIFEYKYKLEHYDTVVEKMAAVILKEYNLITEEDGKYYFNEWPLKQEEIDELIKLCMEKLDGFFVQVQINGLR